MWAHPSTLRSLYCIGSNALSHVTCYNMLSPPKVVRGMSVSPRCSVSVWRPVVRGMSVSPRCSVSVWRPVVREVSVSPPCSVSVWPPVVRGMLDGDAVQL